MDQNPFQRRPAPEEYADFYAGYVGQVPDGDLLGFLRAQRDRALALFDSIPEDRHDYRYAPGKWTTREVIGHTIDVEWVFTYRALRFARGDATPLPGVDQDVLMAGADFARRPIADLGQQFRHLRAANLTLFAGFHPAVLDRQGVASGHPITVRAMLWALAGHTEHHLRVLEERYL